MVWASWFLAFLQFFQFQTKWTFFFSFERFPMGKMKNIIYELTIRVVWRQSPYIHSRLILMRRDFLFPVVVKTNNDNSTRHSHAIFNAIYLHLSHQCIQWWLSWTVRLHWLACGKWWMFHYSFQHWINKMRNGIVRKEENLLNGVVFIGKAP